MPDGCDRRTFLKSGVAATLGVAPGGLTVAGTSEDGTVHMEPARRITIVERADVVICGGGPAGVAAAIAAARCGAKTRLLEVNGCLGGVWTAGLLSWILDASNKAGLMKEILDALQRADALAKYSGAFGYDVEQMKLLLDSMCGQAGVCIQLHTRVVAAAQDPEKRLAVVVTESKSGRQAWAGKVFVDATGDGDLAAAAGCGFDEGRAGSGEVQPMSLLALLTGLKRDEVSPFVGAIGGREAKPRLFAEMKRAGITPSYSHPSLFCIREGLFCMMANHEYGVRANNASRITEATIRARAEVHRLVNRLRTLGGIWKEIRIVATPEHIGVREGRRIRGLYTVSTSDVVSGARHPDAVCRVRFPVDVHSTDPTKCRDIMNENVRAKPYDIPYRALIARDVKGLLMAGRCVSGDFLAHASYRVTGNAVAMGEAAGAAAAIASRTGRLPQDVPCPEIAKAITTRNPLTSR